MFLLNIALSMGKKRRILVGGVFVLLLFTACSQSSRDLSGLAFLFFGSGEKVVHLNAVGPTTSTTLRTLGFTPDDTNAVFVAKTGRDDTGTGTRKKAFLSINKAMTICDTARQKVVIIDSGTYKEPGFEFGGNFQGLYAAPGKTPSLTVLRNEDFLLPDVTIKDETNFLNAAVGTTSCVLLPEGGALIAYVDPADNKGKYVVMNSGWSFSAPKIFHNAATYWTSAALLSDNRIIVVFEDNAESNTGKYALIDANREPVAGETSFGPVNSDYPDVAVMSDGHVIIAYRNSGGKYVVLDEKLDVVKSDGIFQAGYAADMAVSILPNGKVFIAYQGYGTTTSYAGYYTVIDPADSWNATVSGILFRNNDTYDIDTAVYDNGKIIIAYKDESGTGKYMILDSSYAVVKDEASFNNAVTAYPSVGVFDDGSVLLTYQGSDGKGKYRVIANVYSGISVTGAAVINGIRITGDDDPLVHRLFNAGSVSLELDWCDVSGFKHEGSINPYYGIYSTGTVTLANSRMFDSENCIYTSGAVTINDSQLFFNSGTALYKYGTNNMTVDHTDFFSNAWGIYLECNTGGATDSIKNSIFHGNVRKDVDTGTAVDVYNSVYDGSSFNVGAWTDSVNADPLYVNDTSSDSTDIDLNLQTIIEGYAADSPALGLADDGRNSGSLDVEYND